jgi:hypothetical protein
LNPSKAAGPDEIKPKLLKDLSVEIEPILTISFNKSVTTGIVPSDWRTAHVSPVYKKVKNISSNFIRERPFNLKGGLWFFSKKNILIPNVAEKNILNLVEKKKKI